MLDMLAILRGRAQESAGRAQSDAMALEMAEQIAAEAQRVAKERDTEKARADKAEADLAALVKNTSPVGG